MTTPDIISLDHLAEDALSYDPTDALNDALDNTGEIAIEPERIIARLHQEGSINDAERDAAAILHKMFKIGSPWLREFGPATYDWRDKDGKWSRVQQPRSDILAKVDETIEAVRSTLRRRAVRHALACVQPVADIDNLAALAAGIEDVARTWWGVTKRPVIVVNGITMPAFGDARTADAENDNDAPDARRIVEGFERMWKRGQLDRNHDMNESLYLAGLRYRQDHHSAGLAPLGAIDYTRDHVDGGSGAGTSAGGLFGSENATQALERYRSARRAMGARYAAVVDAVVLDGRTLEDAGLQESRYKSGKQAAAVAQERLDIGLRDLAVFYGIITRRQAA